jgi:hypothetical protein
MARAHGAGQAVAPSASRSGGLGRALLLAQRAHGLLALVARRAVQIRTPSR